MFLSLPLPENIPFKYFETCFRIPDNLLATESIPPPASPANISPAETLSVIHMKTLTRLSQISPATSETTFPREDSMSPKPSKPFTALFITFEIPSTILERIPDKPSILNPSLIEVKKSPKDAVMVRIKSTRLAIPSEPSSLVIAPPIVRRTFFPKSTMENSPLNVRLSLSAVSSLIFILAVKFLSPSVKANNCLAVIGGNISLKASLIGLTILEIPSKTFLRDSIKSLRPPKSLHFFKTLLRASADLLTKLPKVSEISVNRDFASSKSPTTILQV